MPAPGEAGACRPYLLEQIKLIRPGIIVRLGALATQTLVDPQARITRVQGQWFERNRNKVLPTFHPAVVLRDREKLQPAAEDFRKLAAARRALEEARAREQQEEQLSLDFSGGGRESL